MIGTAFDGFLSALGTSPDNEYVDRVERAFGVTCSDAARRLLGHTTGSGGAGLFFTVGESAYESENLFTGLLRKPMHLLGAFLNAVPLGMDGGGRTYLLRLGDAEEVGLYDSGLGEVTFLADSPEAFGALNHAWMTFEAYATQHDIDVEAIIDGEPFNLEVPELQEFSSLLDTLKPRLLLTDELDIISDFTEEFCALGGPFRAAAASTMSEDATNTWWLRQVFGQGGLRPADIQAAQKTDASGNVASGLYAMWRGFFLRDESALVAAMDAGSAQSAILLKDTAAFLEGLRGGKALEFAYLGAAGDLAHGTHMEETARTPTKDHPLLAKDDEDEAVQELVLELRKQSTSANRWDQMAYHFCRLERWTDMLEAAKASIAIEAQSYYPWMQLGIALSQLKDHKAALRAYDTGLALEGDNPNLWFNKAGSFVELGMLDDAITHLAFTPAQGRRKTILAMGDDLRVLEGRPGYDALMSADSGSSDT